MRRIVDLGLVQQQAPDLPFSSLLTCTLATKFSQRREHEGSARLSTLKLNGHQGTDGSVVEH